MNIYASSSLHIKKYELEFTPVELKLFMKGVRVHVIPMNISNIVLLLILAKFSFDNNAIKTLSDVRQFVYPFVMHEVYKNWMQITLWLLVTKDIT